MTESTVTINEGTRKRWYERLQAVNLKFGMETGSLETDDKINTLGFMLLLGEKESIVTLTMADLLPLQDLLALEY